MTTQATVAVSAARKAVYDKFQSQIHAFEAALATLKAKAEAAKADAEVKAVANLFTAKLALDEKVAELKQTGETTFDKLKADIDARVSQFDGSIKAIEAKIKTRRA